MGADINVDIDVGPVMGAGHGSVVGVCPGSVTATVPAVASTVAMPLGLRGSGRTAGGVGIAGRKDGGAGVDAVEGLRWMAVGR